MAGQRTIADWYRDRQAWRLIAFRYLPWLGALSLAWEIVQTPLYTLWAEAAPSFIAFSILHCTLGDVLIGGGALLLALLLCRAPGVDRWRWRRIAALTALFGATYTVFSEWMNIAVLGSWSYTEAMPRLRLGDIEVGLAPLLQWLFVPPLALHRTRANLIQVNSAP
jgi:hypothetical protein